MEENKIVYEELEPALVYEDVEGIGEEINPKCDFPYYVHKIENQSACVGTKNVRIAIDVVDHFADEHMTKVTIGGKTTVVYHTGRTKYWRANATSGTTIKKGMTITFASYYKTASGYKQHSYCSKRI